MTTKLCELYDSDSAKPSIGDAEDGMILKDENITRLADQAWLAYKEFNAKKMALTSSMLDWLTTKITLGMIVDVSYANAKSGNIPNYLSGCRVMSGNSRNTKKFRIESIESVEVDLRFFNLSYWICKATPISEKTGDPMSGRVAKSLAYGASTNKDLVTLRFDFFRDHFGDESSISQERR